MGKPWGPFYGRDPPGNPKGVRQRVLPKEDRVKSEHSEPALGAWDWQVCTGEKKAARTGLRSAEETLGRLCGSFSRTIEALAFETLPASSLGGRFLQTRRPFAKGCSLSRGRLLAPAHLGSLFGLGLLQAVAPSAGPVSRLWRRKESGFADETRAGSKARRSLQVATASLALWGGAPACLAGCALPSVLLAPDSSG